ncbi:MAG: UDP-N-acetylmuramate--alanine ligase [Parcubacteria group bacterium Gr01-1014_18]|nr:MAG: UDP-N-acetylmuramate--alanine ligase [Parcubacteria group bacterium Greene0416_36]TSC81538.1 MAG: UDP-N-acetylmuramate--alanine ligase [Parcubacteria group bacterium Gr01-1014_18]TSC99651.1 MAG: UDP-N-acetylmuramate--alanine ligase [Parcubacteria group bacterium Greene1014_20]TSD07102.1 MAG: UDP-N-acetylmuramate--alanine ligase [Parcubacteria group bacterium Greene0714_2]
MDFSRIKSVYMIGVKGVGMTALAQMLQSMGIRVTGSDVAEKFGTDAVLAKSGIEVHEGFSVAHVRAYCNTPLPGQGVIYSTAYRPETNPELGWVMEQKIEALSYPQAVALLFNASPFGISVCGSHGKTTTTAMLACILKDAGLDPKAIIGANVPQLGGNALVGGGDHFILESDEYQKKFLQYRPRAIVLNNIDWEHPDCFPTPADYQKVFEEFIGLLPKDGILVAGIDHPIVETIVSRAKCKLVTFGFSPKAQIRGEKVRVEKGHILFDVGSAEMSLRVPGRHNVHNALGAIALARALQVPFGTIQSSLASYGGVERRLEVLGEKNGVLVIDDYAHNPQKIEASLDALREFYPGRRIVAVFQPHTFSRTEALLAGFGGAFLDADVTVVTDIYASAREAKGTITGASVVAEISKIGKTAYFVPTLDEVEAWLEKSTQKGDVIVFMGAGDAGRVARKFLKK